QSRLGRNQVSVRNVLGTHFTDADFLANHFRGGVNAPVFQRLLGDIMRNIGVKLHVWGEFACFTRPEMKVERVSYDTITPSAARGIIEAIYWKPQIKWRVTRL